MSIVTFPTAPTNPKLAATGDFTYPTAAIPQFFNNNGQFAGFIQNQAGIQAAALLFPLEVSVTNQGYTAAKPAFVDGDVTHSQMSYFYTPTFSAVAKIPNSLGAQVNLNILQDIQSGRIVTFGGVTTSCNESKYFADIATAGGGPTTTNSTCTFSDDPITTISSSANRKVLNAMSFQASNVLDFVTVQVGSWPAQVVAEVKWSIGIQEEFNPRPGSSTTPQGVVYGPTRSSPF